MALARYEGVVTDEAGNVVPLATVEVRRDQAGRPVVPLFADRAGTVPIGNPVQADALGAFGFHLPGGSYWIRAYTGPQHQPTFQVVKRYVPVGTAAERDVEDIATVLEAGIASFTTVDMLQAFTPAMVEGVGGKVTTGPGAGYYHYDPLRDEDDRWVFDRALQDTLAELVIVGGTASDIEAEISAGVDGAVVKMMFIEPAETNPGPVKINGKPLLSLIGEELLPGQFLLGRSYFVSEKEDHFRLRTEGDVSGIPAGIVAAAAVGVQSIDAAKEDAIAEIEPLRNETVEARDAAVPAATVALTQADRSVEAADRSELASDAAQLSAGVFATTAAGITATTNGKYFNVPSPDNDKSLVLYKNQAGTPVEVKQYPSAVAVSNLKTQLGPLRATILPPETGYAFSLDDGNGNAALLVALDGTFYAKFSFADRIPQAMPIESGYAFTVTDTAGNIAFGVDDQGNLVGSITKLIKGREYLQPKTDLWLIGDSTTAGAGGQTMWRTQLPALLTDQNRTIVSYADGGDTSTEQAAKCGGYPSLFTLAGNLLPASGPVLVTAKSSDLLSTTATMKGWFAGVYCTLSSVSDGGSGWTYTLTRAAAGTALTVTPGEPFIPDNEGNDFKTMIVGIGRNNLGGAGAVATIQRDIEAALSMQKTAEKRFLIFLPWPGGTTTAGQPTTEGVGTQIHTNTVALETWAVQKYGDRVLRTRPWSAQFNNGSADDLDDVAKGVVPRSLRIDGVHGTTAFNTRIAEWVAREINRRGW